MKWYGHSNKITANCDRPIIGQIVGWTIAYLILIWFIITSRRRRLRTFLFGTISILSGAFLSIGIYDSNWLTGSGQLKGSYSRWTEIKHGHSEMLVPADLTLHVGLRSLNITFASKSTGLMTFFYNEDLEFERRSRNDVSQMHSALNKGLPNPILSVLDFVLMNQCSPAFEKAGYLTKAFLVFGLIVWSINQLIYLFVPELSAKISILNGLWLSLVTFNYVMMIQKWHFVIYVEGSKIIVTLGRSVILVFISAVLQFLPYILVRLSILPRTSFEVDYGTPWDREYILDHQFEKVHSEPASNETTPQKETTNPSPSLSPKTKRAHTPHKPTKSKTPPAKKSSSKKKQPAPKPPNKLSPNVNRFRSRVYSVAFVNESLKQSKRTSVNVAEEITVRHEYVNPAFVPTSPKKRSYSLDVLI